MTKVGAEREHYKGEQDTTRHKAKASDQLAKVTGAENVRLKTELVDTSLGAGHRQTD